LLGVLGAVGLNGLVGHFSGGRPPQEGPRPSPVEVKQPLPPQPSPDLVVFRHANRQRAGIAVRSDPDLQERYPLRMGALPIVLDCSGSMYPWRTNAQGFVPTEEYKRYRANPDTNSKYFLALAALDQVFRSLPTGMEVSLFTFSQARVNADGVPVTPQP